MLATDLRSQIFACTVILQVLTTVTTSTLKPTMIKFEEKYIKPHEILKKKKDIRHNCLNLEESKTMGPKCPKNSLRVTGAQKIKVFPLKWMVF
uniref:Secreted protein n=1 Tax=Rhizophora mucronata TaxID=61149 RepID=A0A2P2IPE2_RHIMU